MPVARVLARSNLTSGRLGAPDNIVNAADLLIQIRFSLGEITPDPLELQNGDLFPTE